MLIAVSAAVLVVVPSAFAARQNPVPSLTPAATERLWGAEVARAALQPRLQVSVDCRPARVVIYAQTDWLRAATKLAQNGSACAQYYVSVPPLAADKTMPRANQASQIRALGAGFHALDEISFSGWSTWVAAGNGTWLEAGLLARQRMVAAGFDIGQGDSWAMNELSSAVRKGTGSARRNALDFMHGLANDGVRGVAFTAGIGQTTTDLSLYKVNLQDWLQDGPFWTEAAGYVTDWAQETYGDLRAYAVAGSSPLERRDSLVAYLGHEETLANVGPAGASAGRTLLQQTYLPFGNAAWAWESAYGWTAAPVASMEDFVSGQVYADRAFASATGAVTDRLGFAWSPSNSQGLATADFNTQTDAILGRLAAAIHDSDLSSGDPGAAACAPSWCTTSLDGAAFVTGWQGFSTWSPTQPVFITAPTSAATDTAAGPITVQLQTAGIADAALTTRTLSLATTSAAGMFSTVAGGPWTSSLALPLTVGSSSTSFYYQDSVGGTPTITATLDDGTATTQIETVVPPGASPPTAPPTAPVSTPDGTSAPPAPVATPAPLVRATQPPPALKAVVTKRFEQGHLIVLVHVSRGSSRPAGVRVRIKVQRGTSIVALVDRRTVLGGLAQWRSVNKLRRGSYVATATIR